nr:reverse transcriptase domain-containing protein [Tanacetum cinerariifolium]
MCSHIQEARSVSHTTVVAEIQKDATKVLALKKHKLLPRNIATKESIRKEWKQCQKVKEVHEGTESQNQISKCRVLRMTYPNHGSERSFENLSRGRQDRMLAMPTWCHMFNSTLTENAGVWFDDLPKESIDSYDDLRKAFLENYLQQKKCITDPVEIHNIKQRDGESTEEFVWSKFRLEIKNQLIPANTPLIGFSGEIIWPLGQISLLVKIGDEEHSTSAWMNFMVVRSPSPYNGIIGRPGVRKIRAIPSTAHRMIKFTVVGGIVTLRSRRIIPLECSMVSEPGVPWPVINQVNEEKIQVAIHSEYPEQTIAISSTLTEEGRKELYGLLRRHLDVFAWKPADMTGVPRHIAEHRLNVREGCLPVRQKKRGKFLREIKQLVKK